MDISGVTGTGASFGTASTTATTTTPFQSPSSGGSSPTSNALYYPSPITTVDPVTGALIQEWRDPNSGDELYQSPTRAALLYGKAQDPTGTSTTSNGGQTGKQPGSGVSQLT